MYKQSIGLNIIVITLVSLLLYSCNGLWVSQQNKYFTTSVAPDFQQRNIKSVGVYVFSNGSSYSGVQLSHSHYPDDIVATTVFAPDSSNIGPSLELAQAVKGQLIEKGYNASIVDKLGHSKPVTLDQCIDTAKHDKYDAIFVVYYTAIYSWYIDNKLYKGFAYLTNSAMYDSKTRERIWHNSFYGLLENAHTLNIVSSYLQSEPRIFGGYSEENYISAAPKAAAIIFEPEYWPQSFTPLPTRGTKIKKL